MRARSPFLFAVAALGASALAVGASGQPAASGPVAAPSQKPAASPAPGAPSSGEAAGGASPITIVWSAPEGCPERAAVVARVERLLGGPPKDAERKLAAKGSIEAIPGGFRLEIALSSDGAESARVLQGAQCGSVTDAAALVIALAFDPEAVAAQGLKQGTSDTSVGPDGAAPGVAPASSAPPADTVSPPAPTAVIRIPVLFPFLPPPAPARPPPPVAKWLSFGGFAELAGDAGSLPSVAPGLRAGLSLGLGAFRIEPAFEAFPSSRSALPGKPSVGAELRLLAFALDVCRRVLPWSREDSLFRAAACLGFEVGEMRGAGFGVTQPTSGAALWGATRAEAQVELALARWAFVRADIGLVVPLDRRRFVLDLEAGRSVVHEPSAVAGRAGVGAGVRF